MPSGTPSNISRMLLPPCMNVRATRAVLGACQVGSGRMDRMSSIRVSCSSRTAVRIAQSQVGMWVMIRPSCVRLKHLRLRSFFSLANRSDVSV